MRPSASGRGFYYATEAAQLLSLITGLRVDRNTINTAIIRGTIKANTFDLPGDDEISSGINEIEPDSFWDYAEDYRPRREITERPSLHYTISEAADIIGITRKEMYDLVYSGQIESTRVQTQVYVHELGGDTTITFRFISHEVLGQLRKES